MSSRRKGKGRLGRGLPGAAAGGAKAFPLQGQNEEGPLPPEEDEEVRTLPVEGLDPEALEDLEATEKRPLS